MQHALPATAAPDCPLQGAFSLVLVLQAARRRTMHPAVLARGLEAQLHSSASHTCYKAWCSTDFLPSGALTWYNSSSRLRGGGSGDAAAGVEGWSGGQGLCHRWFGARQGGLLGWRRHVWRAGDIHELLCRSVHPLQLHLLAGRQSLSWHCGAQGI